MSRAATTHPLAPGVAAVPSDEQLVADAVSGDGKALEELLLRHQPWIFNIALRMVYRREDAEDVTQEVLVKIVTNLAAFRGDSAFRTWLYRIVANHILSMRRRTHEKEPMTFTDYGRALDGMKNLDPPDTGKYAVDLPILVEEVKLSCLAGMLLCLDRRQRLVYILAEILGVSAQLGGEVLEITAENFRQILARARRDLYQFMRDNCGLVNPANPCRCERKTRAFIQAGIVDPDEIRFSAAHLSKIRELAPASAEALESIEEACRDLHRDSRFAEHHDAVGFIRNLLSSDVVRNRLMTDDQVGRDCGDGRHAR